MSGIEQAFPFLKKYIGSHECASHKNRSEDSNSGFKLNITEFSNPTTVYFNATRVKDICSETYSHQCSQNCIISQIIEEINNETLISLFLAKNN